MDTEDPGLRVLVDEATPAPDQLVRWGNHAHVGSEPTKTPRREANSPWLPTLAITAQTVNQCATISCNERSAGSLCRRFQSMKAPPLTAMDSPVTNDAS